MFNRACRVAKLCVKAELRALITVEPYARIGHVRFIGGDGSRELSLPGRMFQDGHDCMDAGGRATHEAKAEDKSRYHIYLKKFS